MHIATASAPTSSTSSNATCALERLFRNRIKTFSYSLHDVNELPRIGRQALQLQEPKLATYDASQTYNASQALFQVLVSRLCSRCRRWRRTLSFKYVRTGLCRTFRCHGRPRGEYDAFPAYARKFSPLQRIICELHVWSQYECILC